MEEKPRGRKSPKWWLLVCAGLVGALVLGGVVFLHSASFQEILRRRLVSAMEGAIGGRVELQQFSFELGRLQVDLRGLTIHGREGTAEPPLFSAELIQAGWKLVSFWGLRADLRSLRIWSPHIYVARYEDGRSNIPLPGRKAAADQKWVEEVLALRVQRLEVLRGQLRWQMRSNERRLPLDFQAENVHLALDYDPAGNGYSGRLEFQNALLNSRKVTPLRFRGRTKFALYSQKAEVESFEWQSAGSRLSAQGTIENFDSPRLQFRYDMLVDLKEAAEFLGSSGWRGEIAWQGQGSYAEQGWQLEGPVGLRSARIGIASFPKVPWSARAALRLVGGSALGGDGKSPPWRAELKGLELAALGGRFTGRATVEMAFPALSTPTGAPPFGDAVVTARLELQADHISVAALSSALSTLPVPLAPYQTDSKRGTVSLSSDFATGLARLQWAGSISGPMQVSFQGAGRRLQLRTDWRVDLPPVLPPGFTPVSGNLRLSYQAEQSRLEIQGSNLNLPHTSLAADGWLDAADSRLTVTIDTTSLEDSRSLVGLVWKQSAQLPLRLQGRAKASFVWTGGTRSPRANGSFQLSDFDYQNSRWDGFSGNFNYRQDSGKYTEPFPLPPGRGSDLDLRKNIGERAISSEAGKPSQAGGSQARSAEIKLESGRLWRGSAVMQFNASVELKNGAFTLESPFSVDATFRNANLEDLQNLAGTRFPIRGTLQASFRASGTPQDPHGQGNILLTSGEAYGETFERLAAQMVLESGGVVSARQVRLQKGKGALEGEAVVGAETKRYRFSLSGSNLALESFRLLHMPHFPLTGLARVTLSGTGSLLRPAVQGQIEISGIGLAGRKEGKLSIGVDAREGQGHLVWAGNLFGGEVRGSGEVKLQNSFPLSARMDFENMDLVSLLRAVREPPRAMQGKAGGTVVIEGDLKNAQALRFRGELGTLTVSVEQADFRSAQPMRFHYENRVIQLEQIHLIGKDTDLQAAGTVRLARDPALNLAVKGHGDLAALAILDPDLSSSGQVLLDANLNGTLGKPLWSGRLDFSEANLRYGSIPNGLTRIKGSLVFEGNRASLENFTAESGGGTVKLGGFITYMPETGLEMQLPAEFSGVRVRYPEGVSTWLDGRLTLTGSSKTSMLAGRLVITKETANPEFDVGAALVSRQKQPLVSVKAASLRNLRLDVQIVSATNISLETTTAKNLQGDVELRIQGTVEQPALLGRISILQGEISIGGRRYLADRGELTFSNPFRIEPVLNLRVRARVEQYDINLNFSGPLDRLTLTYNSDPPLPTSEILSLLVAGSSYGTSRTSSSTGTMPELGVNSLLSQALNQQMGNRLDRIFGAGHIRIDPQIAGFDSPANANVALEEHIKDNVTLLYVTNVTSAQQRIIQGELALSPRFSVIANRDQNGLIGVNFQIKLRFR